MCLLDQPVLYQRDNKALKKMLIGLENPCLLNWNGGKEMFQTMANFQVDPHLEGEMDTESGDTKHWVLTILISVIHPVFFLDKNGKFLPEVSHLTDLSWRRSEWEVQRFSRQVHGTFRPWVIQTHLRPHTPFLERNLGVIPFKVLFLDHHSETSRIRSFIFQCHCISTAPSP